MRLRPILIILGNPKIILFYGALLPTFVDFDALAVPAITILATIVVAAILVVNNFFGLMAAGARRIFRSGRSVKILNRSAGSAMIGAGIFIATR
ncbi:LysE family transporter [Nisaea sp.]|uniref:LysE family translocator n=1 Tax=Nisaea sp. TaxID=2024842 RepID=UPI0032ED0CEF